MKLSLSVRVAEEPKRKDVAAMPIEELAPLAKAAGFAGLSMRASVVSVASPAGWVQAVKGLLGQHGLAVSMVTGDIGLAANDASATDAIRGIGPYLDLAARLDCRLVRVMMQSEDDIPFARHAADLAAARGMTLAHMTHWGTLIETADDALRVVRAVGRPGFGVVYEPANMLACADEYGAEAIRRMAPLLVNVMFQNVRKDPDSPLTFRANRHGPVGVRYVAIDDASGLDGRAMIDTLKEVGYDGWITVHQPLREGQTVADSVREAADFFGPLVA